MQISDLLRFLQSLKAPKAHTVLEELCRRLQSLVDIGLGYLSLDRQTATLSGGESQRIKMVKHLGSSLSDIVYIFDEPSTGLHPSNVHKLNELLRQLRDKGNTILVVEHDPDVMKVADHIIDMGPGAGQDGGTIVYQGSLGDFKHATTPTAQFLHRQMTVKSDVRAGKGALTIQNTSRNNLQHVSVAIPKEVMTVITGVAGSGKSSLTGVLAQQFPEAIMINQDAIQASKRSTPASFIGIFDAIRELFAKTNGVSASLFSFNSDGACPECKGLGIVTTDLAFMDPIVTTCERCKGKRFTDETLGYMVKKKNIYDVLTMSIQEACDFFSEPDIHDTLEQLKEVGLGYLCLGQPLDTLSGGERQRIKLALHLTQRGNLYILDEPTTGLHMSDVARLLRVINRLVDNHCTVIVVEHNLDVISQADWMIDVGPGAGYDGGRIIFEGTPAEAKQHKSSVTGQYL